MSNIKRFWGAIYYAHICGEMFHFAFNVKNAVSVDCIAVAYSLLTSRLGDPETWVLVSRPVFTNLGLGLGLEPRSLGLRLGTSESCSWSWTWDHGDSELKCVGWSGHVQSAASIARKSSVRLPPLLLWNGYLATVVCWCGQTGLEWVTTCCHSWSTCCKFSCCCTVVISL